MSVLKSSARLGVDNALVVILIFEYLRVLNEARIVVGIGVSNELVGGHVSRHHRVVINIIQVLKLALLTEDIHIDLVIRQNVLLINLHD